MKYRQFTFTYFSAIILFFIAFSFNHKVIAQANTFEGTITYKITPRSFIDIALASALPKEAVVKLKGNKYFLHMESPNIKQSIYLDGDNFTAIDVVEINGTTYAMHKNKQQVEDELDQSYAPIVEYTDSTKEILGIKVKKAIVTTKDDWGNEYPSNVWYADEFGGKDLNFYSDFREINGLLLDYEFISNGLKLGFTAIKIKKGKVSDKAFIPPKDAWEVSIDELRKMLTGGN